VIGRLERGGSTVETAVIMALFLVPLLLGLVDVSRLIFTRIAIQEAAQQGALYYAFEEEVDPVAVGLHTVAATSTPGLSLQDVTTACEPARAGDESIVTVTVSHDVDLVFPVAGGMITVSADATSRRFQRCPGGHEWLVTWDRSRMPRTRGRRCGQLSPSGKRVGTWVG